MRLINSQLDNPANVERLNFAKELRSIPPHLRKPTEAHEPRASPNEGKSTKRNRLRAKVPVSALHGIVFLTPKPGSGKFHRSNSWVVGKSERFGLVRTSAITTLSRT